MAIPLSGAASCAAEQRTSARPAPGAPKPVSSAMTSEGSASAAEATASRPRRALALLAGCHARAPEVSRSSLVMLAHPDRLSLQHRRARFSQAAGAASGAGS